MPVEFRYGEKIFQGCWTLNWKALDNTVSGLKLLAKLMEDYDNRFLIGLTSDSVRIYEAYKIPVLMQMPRWVGIIDPEKVSSYFRFRGESDFQKLNDFSLRLMRHEDAAGIWHCARLEPEEEFHWNYYPRVRGYVRRTGRYLNWRYIDIPNHNYRVIKGASGQFAVYRIEKIRGLEDSVIRIMEWNFLGEWAAKALAAILQKGIHSRAILIDFFCTAQEIGSELVKLGLVPSTSFQGESIPYLFRPIYYTDDIRLAIDMPPHREERHVDFGEWYITKGDSDLDRVKL